MSLEKDFCVLSLCRTAAETRRIENQKEEEKQRQDHLNFLQCKLDSAQQRSVTSKTFLVRYRGIGMDGRAT